MIYIKYLTANLIACVLMALSSQAFAVDPISVGKNQTPDEGPCAEIECEIGDKFCDQKKKECTAKYIEKKQEEAKVKAIESDKKAK